MIKHYSLFAKWRKKDIEFLNNLNLERTIEEGYFGFRIEEGNVYEKIKDYFSKKDSLFSITKPPEFSINFAVVTFSKEELDNAKYFALSQIGGESGTSKWPQPYKTEPDYQKQVFKFDGFKNGKVFSMTNKSQISPFRIKKPKWGKDQKCFNLGLEYEYVCFKKEFFQEVLTPLGLKSMEVINHTTGKVLEDTVQLIIPTAKSKLLLENSAYDIHPSSETGGYKQYAVQTLDFFPDFQKDFDFYICHSQEDFYIGHKKIIISKEFCDLLINYKIVPYNTWNLTPLKLPKKLIP